MLYENTVAPATLGRLRELMQVEVLKSFALVGGTNLSLRLGHRISEDLDVFANEPYDSDEIASPLLELFPGEINIVEQRAHTLLAYIRTVKVDIVLHRYPYLQPIEVIEGLRLASPLKPSPAPPPFQTPILNCESVLRGMIESHAPLVHR